VSKLRGTVDFMYVADSKLATKENMAHIASRGGRFISVLPRTRAEDKAFRELQHEGRIEWFEIHNKRDERGEVADVYSVATETSATAEGYRLLWFHSTRKDDLDSASRSKKIDRALDSLIELRQKLRSPRTRYTQEPKVREEVAKRLAEHGAERWFTVHIDKFEQEDFKQERRGRPGKNMRYVRQVKTRFDILWELNAENIAADARQDGIFPLVTNDQELPIEEVLLTYKRQPLIEKRFSQLKTDYAVAPIFLKSVARIEALLTIYFLALVVQALLERELRRAMKKQRVHSLPLYAEERDCRAPTTRKVIDTFENVHSHKLTRGESDDPTYFVTELSPLQTDILSLLRVPPSDYSSIG
jgi:transposase